MNYLGGPRVVYAEYSPKLNRNWVADVQFGFVNASAISREKLIMSRRKFKTGIAWCVTCEVQARMIEGISGCQG